MTSIQDYYRSSIQMFLVFRSTLFKEMIISMIPWQRNVMLTTSLVCGVFILN